MTVVVVIEVILSSMFPIMSVNPKFTQSCQAKMFDVENDIFTIHNNVPIAEKHWTETFVSTISQPILFFSDAFFVLFSNVHAIENFMTPIIIMNRE